MCEVRQLGAAEELVDQVPQAIHRHCRHARVPMASSAHQMRRHDRPAPLSSGRYRVIMCLANIDMQWTPVIQRTPCCTHKACQVCESSGAPPGLIAEPSPKVDMYADVANPNLPSMGATDRPRPQWTAYATWQARAVFIVASAQTRSTVNRQACTNSACTGIVSLRAVERLMRTRCGQPRDGCGPGWLGRTAAAAAGSTPYGST